MKTTTKTEATKYKCNHCGKSYSAEWVQMHTSKYYPVTCYGCNHKLVPVTTK